MAEDNVLGGFTNFGSQLMGNRSSIIEEGATNISGNYQTLSPEEIMSDIEEEVIEADDVTSLEDDDEDIDINTIRDLRTKQGKGEDDADDSADATDADDDASDDSSAGDLSADVDDTIVDKAADNVDDDWSKQENTIAAFIAEQLGSKLGWQIKEEDKFENIEDVVGYLAKVSEENSKPQYFNDEVKELDEFVREGGDLKAFYNQFYESRIDVDSIDISTESGQRAVVRQNLKDMGVKEEKINKTIGRFEETGILEEQAEDAAEFIKEYEGDQKKKLLENQKNLAVEQKKQQQNFIQEVESNIRNTDNIMGISINEGEKRDLLKYILEADQNGLTQYQRDSAKDITTWLESAYFTKRKDTFLQDIKRKAKTDSTKELKKRLENSRSNKSKGRNSSDSENVSLTDFLNSSNTRRLRRP